MINKQNLWFITLFSLILILGIYYVSMPSETLSVFSSDAQDNSTMVNVKESDIIVAMKVEEEEKVLSKMQDAQNILLDNSASVEDKNSAYEALQLLNMQKGKTMEIEKIIKEKYKLDSFAKIDGNKINIILSSKDEGKEFANKVINEVQKLYDNQMYITIKFQE